jgi:hypothetical protein
MTLKLAYILHLIFCVAFGLMVWVQVNTYGTTPECNLNSSVKFVVFGHSISATSKGLRGFGISLFSFIGASLLFIGLALTLRPIKKWEDRSSWWWMVPPLSSWVYEVITIEEIIRRNKLSESSNQWSYGQTFALVLLIGPALDFVSAMWRKKTEREPVSGTKHLLFYFACPDAMLLLLQ